MICHRHAVSVPGVDGRTANKKCVRKRRAAIVLQRREHGVEGRETAADLVTVDSISQAAGEADISDEIVTKTGKCSCQIRTGSQISSDDCVCESGRSEVVNSSTHTTAH